jgi:DNA adenine methylase
LRPFYPSTFGSYYEPFLGSGAVFFDLLASGALESRPVLLSDQNPDLIGTWLRVRDSVGPLIAALTRLAGGHARGGAEHYRRIRDGRFNPARQAWLAEGADPAAYTVDMAAIFLYLNRTGYNGLFRVNRRGAFNVPPGRYEKPTICDAAHLRAVSAALAAPGVSIELAPFHTAALRARRGDFVYCDPPYVPLTRTANFRGYTAGGFDEGEQARLQEVVLTLAHRGVHVLVSNSSAPLVVELYGNREASAAGLRLLSVPARRAINTRADRRGLIDETLVTNYGA